MSSDEFRKESPQTPIIYNPSSGPSLGVELEIFLVDPETGDLVPRAAELLAELGEDAQAWAKNELFQSIIEVITKKCENIDEVRDDLSWKMKRLFQTCDRLGVQAIATGTHPFSRWSDQPITQKERYVRLVNRMGWPARQLLITGTHVHVGVDSGEKAISIMNSLCCFIPHLLAFSANSPFWQDEDTHLASMRLKVFEPMPTAGLPPKITNWAEFVRLMRTLINAGAIESIREIWWDIRPHPGFGTVEIRIMDNVGSLTELMAIVSFVQSLVKYLSDRYDSGQPLAKLSNWTLKENKWRAVRWADEAELIRNESGNLAWLRDHVEEVMEAIRPAARELKTEPYLRILEDILDRGPGYKRQRRYFESTRDKKDLVHELARTFREDAPFRSDYPELSPIRNSKLPEKNQEKAVG